MLPICRCDKCRLLKEQAELLEFLLETLPYDTYLKIEKRLTSHLKGWADSLDSAQLDLTVQRSAFKALAKQYTAIASNPNTHN